MQRMEIVKHLRKLIPILLLALLTIIGISQSNYSGRIQENQQKINLISNLSNVDCYTYVRVYENGFWWIYVYDCEGILIEIIRDDED